jgi:hypothetical protein
VSVDELVAGASIALGTARLERCPAFDTRPDQQVTIDELVGAVGHARDGCTDGGE